MYKNTPFIEPYGIAFWFDNLTMSTKWYKNREERDNVITQLKDGGQLRIKWDYSASGNPYSNITPKRFFAFDTVTENYEISQK